MISAHLPGRFWRPAPRTALLSLGGALGLWLGFPNALLHAPLLVLLYPAALYLLGVEASGKVDALRRGWISGLAGASAALYWVALPVYEVGGLPWALAAPCALGIGAYVGLYGGLFSFGAYLLRALPPLRRALACALLWYLLEVFRGFFLTGFPWLSLATAFVPWPAFIQAASLVGAYALGGWLVWAALCLASPWLVNPCPSTPHKTKLSTALTVVTLALGLALLLALPVYGLIQLRTDPLAADCAALQAHPDAFPVIMVEGNIDQNQKWETAIQDSTVQLYMRLSREALSQWWDAQGAAVASSASPTPLILWPETSMPFYFDQHPRYRPVLLDFARELGTPLLLGAPGLVRPTPKSFQIFNRAYLLDGQGRPAGYYDKIHLVPFGEYVPPWLALEFLLPLLQGVGDFTPGGSTEPLRTGNLALGLLICYESIFPEIAREHVARGANVLVNISNDGWFGDSAAPEQHLQLAVMRAVEQGRWLLRSTNTGISAVVDHRGRLVMRGEQFKAQSLTSCARRMEGFTLFHVLQPWLPMAALVALLALLLGHRASAARGRHGLDN